jgi:glycyl-tRNA synthetase
MELNFLSKPVKTKTGTAAWVEMRLDWWEQQGVGRSQLELYHVPADELAHYSKATVDVMYRFPHGLEELEGIANRTDFDLGSHTKNQGDFDLTAAVEPNKDSNAKTGAAGSGSQEMACALCHRAVCRR